MPSILIIGGGHVDGKPVGGRDTALLDKLQTAYQAWFDRETAK